MKLKLAAFIVAVCAANATPASACFLLGCVEDAVADDTYPPGETALPPALQEEIRARAGKGLSTAGFYNDPSLALAVRDRRVVRARY